MPRFQRSPELFEESRGCAPSLSLSALHPWLTYAVPLGLRLKGEGDLRVVFPQIPARGCRCTTHVVLPHVCLHHRGYCMHPAWMRDYVSRMAIVQRRRSKIPREMRIVSKKFESDGDLRMCLRLI